MIEGNIKCNKYFLHEAGSFAPARLHHPELKKMEMDALKNELSMNSKVRVSPWWLEMIGHFNWMGG